MRRMLSSLNSFRSDNRGNFAVLFGITVIPLIGIMGLAIDYSMANGARTSIQAALDNTALALSRQMPLTDDVLKSKGWTMFTSELGSSPLTFTESDFAAAKSGDTSITLSLDSKYPLKVAGVLAKFGVQPTMDVGTRATVSWGNTRLRVALVLDNTGSMADDGKMDALKTATKSLLTTLKGAIVNPGDVYVSIIPFSKDVNLGSSNYNANYLDWTAWDIDWKANNGTCTIPANTNKAACEAKQDVGSCSDPQYTKKSKCENHNGTWTVVHNVTGTWTPATMNSSTHASWNGCVTDRGATSAPGTAADYDQKIDTPVNGQPATQFPTEQFSGCTIPVRGLSGYNTSDWTSMNSMVDDMTPNGNTNQPIGLVWGWQSLVGGGPLVRPALEANYVYNTVIILMSDGLNTQDRWYGDATSIDRRMYYKSGSTVSGTCKNIKDTGILIYSVQVNTGGDATSTLMKNCANDPSMFFELKTAGALVTTFNQIGTNLANLHIAK
jgi:Flp pilus assembly protein TadG